MDKAPNYLILNPVFDKFKEIKDIRVFINSVLELIPNCTFIWTNSKIKCRIIEKKDIEKCFYDKNRNSHNEDLEIKNANIICYSSNDIMEFSNCDIIYLCEKENIAKLSKQIDQNSINIKLATDLENLNYSYNSLINLQNLQLRLENFIDEHDYVNSSICYEKMAGIYSELKLINKSKTHFAYAAIMLEKSEKWRYISYLWYSAYQHIDDKGINYKDYNTLYHSYPTISFDKWDSFEDLEKNGRALQYSAYSEDNYNGPSDSYWIYEKAVYEYISAKKYDRAIECLVSATNRYSKCYHHINEELMNLWKALINMKEVQTNEDLLLRSFVDIYKRLYINDTENSKFFYKEAKKLENKQMKQNKKYLKIFLDEFGILLQIMELV